MKIQLKSANRSFTILIPNVLLTSPHVLALGYWVTKKTSGKYSAEPMPEVSAATLKPLCKELRRIKKQYGHYELVEVKRSGGQLVRITL